MAATLKIVLILENTQYLQELLETLQSFKIKQLGLTHSSYILLSSNPILVWCKNLQFPSFSQLQYLVVILVFLGLGFWYQWVYK